MSQSKASQPKANDSLTAPACAARIMPDKASRRVLHTRFGRISKATTVPAADRFSQDKFGLMPPPAVDF
jgi:hypothetical protein